VQQCEVKYRSFGAVFYCFTTTNVPILILRLKHVWYTVHISFLTTCVLRLILRLKHVWYTVYISFLTTCVLRLMFLRQFKVICWLYHIIISVWQIVMRQKVNNLSGAIIHVGCAY